MRPGDARSPSPSGRGSLRSGGVRGYNPSGFAPVTRQFGTMLTTHPALRATLSLWEWVGVRSH